MSKIPCPGWPVKLGFIQQHVICVKENTAATLHVHDTYIYILYVASEQKYRPVPPLVGYISIKT